MPNQEHERERDQTHSYWYIPSAPRVNYSLLVMDSAGMMNMVTGSPGHLRPGPVGPPRHGPKIQGLGPMGLLVGRAWA